MAEPTANPDHPKPQSSSQSLTTAVQNLRLNNQPSGEVAEKDPVAVNGETKNNLEEKSNEAKTECNNNDVLKTEGVGGVGSVNLNAEEVVEKFPKWADDEGENSKDVVYPQRPGRLECAFYMRTGNCGFGLNCKFHHPPRTSMSDQITRRDWGEATEIAREKGAEDFLRKSGPMECKYYRLPGGCKYGKSCKYEHPVLEKIEAQPASLNFLGLPLRVGVKDCAYYMNTSACKFSVNCCFNHPEPTAITGENNISGHTDESYLQQNSPVVPVSLSLPSQQHTPVVSTSLSSSSEETPSSTVPMSNTLPSYISKMLIPSREANLSSAPKEYQATVSIHFPTFTKTEQTPDVPSDGTMTIGEYAPSQVQVDFPERPGQLECPFLMKTGNCKFGSRCKFHHPRNRPLKAYTSPHGLPLRPDEPICSSYNRFRICKYGPACKFDHPLDSNPSVGAARSYREIVNARALQMEG